MAFCLVILICALNPSLTQALANRVQTFRQNVFPDNQGIITEQQARGEGELPEAIPGVNVDWMPNRDTEGYLVPASMPENLPAEVKGLWGYESVSVDTQQIIQEEADNLSEILANGELDVEFLLPESYFPYYLMLEPGLQILYKQIYANILAMVTSFVPVADVSLAELSTVFEAVLNDHPELVLVETGYSCMYLEDGTCAEITLKYNDLINDEAARLDYLDKALELLHQADALGSDFEKEKYVHDRLAEMAEYDLNAPYNQTAYSTIENGRTVCAGYAKAFQMIMMELGIPCYYCTGYAGEAHAWNIVLLDGKYYNVDLTWDDTDPLTYDYFNKTDAEFADTHVRTGLSVYLPACTGTIYNAEALANIGQSDGQENSENNEASDSQDAEDTTDTPSLMQPITWESSGLGNRDDEENEESEEDRAAAEHQANLDKAGIREEDVLDNMTEYFEDCEAMLKLVGVGDGQFSNVIPAGLWSAVERSYSSGTYWNGYVDHALEELNAENFSIQLQVQDLGGGYYRLYHNVYVY